MMPEPATAEEMRARYKALRERTFGRQGPVIVPRSRVQPRPKPQPQPMPAVTVAETDSAYLRTRCGETRSVAPILRQIAEKHGVTIREIVSPVRARRVVAAKREAIVAVAKARPAWSLNRLGRAFNTDHSSILHHFRASGFVRPAIMTGAL